MSKVLRDIIQAILPGPDQALPELAITRHNKSTVTKRESHDLISAHIIPGDSEGVHDVPCITVTLHGQSLDARRAEGSPVYIRPVPGRATGPNHGDQSILAQRARLSQSHHHATQRAMCQNVSTMFAFITVRNEVGARLYFLFSQASVILSTGGVPAPGGGGGGCLLLGGVPAPGGLPTSEGVCPLGVPAPEGDLQAHTRGGI